MDLIDKDALRLALLKSYYNQDRSGWTAEQQAEMRGIAERIDDFIFFFPTVESRPTGKWIEIIEPITDPKVNFFERLESRDTPRAYKCDNCERIVESKENFCPRCGENKEIRNERDMGK